MCMCARADTCVRVHTYIHIYSIPMKSVIMIIMKSNDITMKSSDNRLKNTK